MANEIAQRKLKILDKGQLKLTNEEIEQNVEEAREAVLESVPKETDFRTHGIRKTLWKMGMLVRFFVCVTCIKSNSHS